MDIVRERSQAIRKARNLTIALFLGFPLVGITAVVLFRFLGLEEEYTLIVIIPYMVVFLVVGIRCSYASCPICAARMFLKWFIFCWSFRCIHCGYDLKDPKTSRAEGTRS